MKKGKMRVVDFWHKEIFTVTVVIGENPKLHAFQGHSLLVKEELGMKLVGKEAFSVAETK